MFIPTDPDLKSLQLLMETAQIGWWKADFQTGEVLLSDFLVDMLGLPGSSTHIEQLIPFIRQDFREHLHSQFFRLTIGSKFDETFPVTLPEGDVWVHMQLVRKQSGSNMGFKLFGYTQRVAEVRDRREAEIVTLESAYQTLRRENRHMDDVLDKLPVGYLRVRLLYDDRGVATDFMFLSVNRTAQQILGIGLEDYLNKTSRELGLPTDEYITVLSNIRMGDYVATEWYEEKTQRYSRNFLYNTPNDATEIVILLLDDTDTVMAHKALDEQEKLLRNVIQNAPIGIEIYNPEGRLIAVNNCDLDMFGVKDREEILGINIFENPNFTDQTKACLLRGEGTDFTARYDFSKLGGYYTSTNTRSFDWTARIRCLYNDRGEIANYLLINIDNTELRRTQDRLAEFEEVFRLISEYARVGYANYNLYTLTGYAQSVWLNNYGESGTTRICDVIGHYDHLHPEDRHHLMDALEKFKSGEISSKTVTCRILHDDGSMTWTKTHLICRDYRPQEKVIEMLGINYDITPLKQTEQALIAAKERAEEANKLKSAFLANMSHEIRTPLNAIVGFSELLGTEEDPATRQEYIDVIACNNSLLLQIISDVLDLARIESGRIDRIDSEFDARDLCRETAKTFRLQCHEGVVLRTEDNLPAHMITTYKQGVTQVVGNFTRNALKFTTEGSVTVGFETRPGWLRFYVRDTGIGIPGDKVGHVFERFYKADSFTQGTGLGLSICKAIAEQLGGAIGVDSEVGKGSCFWIDLPEAE